MRVVDFHDGDLQMLLKAAAGMGRDGDTQLVHINNAEEKMLRNAGGRGTINPKTGLKEFAEGGIGNSGSERSDRGNESKSGSGSKSGGSGERGTASQQQDRRNYESARRAGNVAPGVKGSEGDRRSTAGMSPTDIARGFINRDAVNKDAANTENTFVDEVGNFIAGLFGFGEMAPATQDVGNFVNKNTASWGIDPIAAALGVGGIMNPVAQIAGIGYGLAKRAGVFEGPMIGFDNNFASPMSAPGGMQTASGARGGTDVGVGGGKQGGNTNQDKRENNPAGPVKFTPSKPDTNKTTATPPTKAAPPQSPADILLNKFKLPGINAPFALAPYSINQKPHQRMVQSALSGR